MTYTFGAIFEDFTRFFYFKNDQFSPIKNFHKNNSRLSTIRFQIYHIIYFWFWVYFWFLVTSWFLFIFVLQAKYLIRTRREITLSSWAPNFVRKKVQYLVIFSILLKNHSLSNQNLPVSLRNSEFKTLYFQRLVQFTESIPEFSGLRNLEHGLEDQIRLLSFSVTGLICLLASRTYDNHTETIFYRSHRKIDNFRPKLGL